MCPDSEHLTLSVSSHPRYLQVVRDFLTSWLTTIGCCSRERMSVVLAVHEALSNIIKHCYQGDVAQRIDITVYEEAQTITIEMRDYGAQPDVACIKPRDLQEIRPGGIGTHLMRSIMDEITYDLSSGTGTVLRMRKRRSEPCTST